VEVKWSDREGFYAEGLLIVDCETREDVCSVMSEGARNRKVGYWTEHVLKFTYSTNLV
jgi:hypothetical protein